MQEKEIPKFITMKEMASELRVSVDTLRRYFVDGKLPGIQWADFLGNGRLRATRESFEAFKDARLAQTKKILSQAL